MIGAIKFDRCGQNCSERSKSIETIKFDRISERSNLIEAIKLFGAIKFDRGGQVGSERTDMTEACARGRNVRTWLGRVSVRGCREVSVASGRHGSPVLATVSRMPFCPVFPTVFCPDQSNCVGCFSYDCPAVFVVISKRIPVRGKRPLEITSQLWYSRGTIVSG